MANVTAFQRNFSALGGINGYKSEEDFDLRGFPPSVVFLVSLELHGVGHAEALE
jgi:hypothetical protein